MGSGTACFVVTAFMGSARGPDESGHYKRRKLYGYVRVSWQRASGLREIPVLVFAGLGGDGILA